VIGAAGTAAAEPMTRLADSVPAVPAVLGAGRPAPPDLPLAHVVVALRLRDREGLDAILAAQQDPRSPRHGRWLDRRELAERFLPRASDYEAVRGWFVGRGFRVVHDSPLRLHLVVAGTAAEAERALGAPIRLFRHGARTFRAPVAAPAVPARLAGTVRAVFGLDDLPLFRRLILLDPATDGCVADEPCTALAPADFRAAYGLDPLVAAGLTGAGRSIAIVARSNYADGDVAEFNSRFLGIARPLPTRFFVGRDPGIFDEGELTEVLIDSQWAGAIAPGAAVNVVIGGPQNSAIFDATVKAVEERLGDVISVSFGLCEQLSIALAEVFDAVYAVANSQGQTVTVASGDFGASDCLASDPPRRGLAVNGLASSPHAVAVGGTAFALNADGTVPQPPLEQVWNDGILGGGGGESIVFARPRYQFGPGVPRLAGRVLPDVSLAGDPAVPGYTIVLRGATRLVGGTSVGAPAFAGFVALVNERRGLRGLGQLLPELYRLGGEQARGLRAPVFRDVTVGTNAVEGPGSGFAAGPGFDLATGWGVPIAEPLAAAIGVPGRCEAPIACLVPGGSTANGCTGEWLLEWDRFAVRRNGVPIGRQRCRDGDVSCDADGNADGRCTVKVALCVNVYDFRTLNAKRSAPRCKQRRVRSVQLVQPKASAADPLAAGNRRTLAAALAALPPFPSKLQNGCTATVPIIVPVQNGRAGTVDLRARIRTSRGPVLSRIRLSCDPR
jgi:subtilase family serine protease